MVCGNTDYDVWSVSGWLESGLRDTCHVARGARVKGMSLERMHTSLHRHSLYTLAHRGSGGSREGRRPGLISDPRDLGKTIVCVKNEV